MVREAPDKDPRKTTRPDCVWPEIQIGMSHAAKKASKARVGYREAKARQCSKLSGIFFIDREDEDYEETIKTARKKLETLLKAAMPCKMVARRCFKELREAVASEDTHPHKKIKYARVVQAHESTRKRLESTLPRNHEDHIAERGFNSLTRYNLVNKFSDAPSDENSGCDSSSA